ncbi:MAG TPA: YCF48-related protein, partial [Pyrinomonadaceae bacterium]|nr:YCF48-related protein [Pyrinomonadaceae bacterium]
MKKAEGGRQKAVGVRALFARSRPRLRAVRLTFCIGCLLPSAFCLLVPAARAEWSLQRSGTMAWLRAVHFTDERTGWAVGGNGALLATADGGATWQARIRPTADALRDVFFVDQKTGWLVCERNVFALKSDAEARSYLLRTTDGGESWSRVEPTKDEPGVLLARVAFADSARGWVFGEMGAL